MKLFILASHPVQYHAPVFREIADRLAARGDEAVVVYLSDFSIQGYRDREFGASFAWDEPLLAGYRSIILNPQQTSQPQGFHGLDAPGFGALLDRERPDRLLVHTLNYRGAIAAVWAARRRGIPCTLRVETNDRAVPRSFSWRGKLKTWLRSQIYRTLYRSFDSAVAIGSLNREHLIRHGLPSHRVGLAYYCVPDRFAAIDPATKGQLRQTTRANLGIKDHQTALLFCGKLIPKKHPDLILAGIAHLPESWRSHLVILYVGSGDLTPQLEAQAAALAPLSVQFLGFKNQQELPPYYLAADVLVLPSRQAGETWGLVVNEGLQAGLACIVSGAAGCTADFGTVPGVEVIPPGDATAMAKAIEQVAGWPRLFDRYRQLVQGISTTAAAEAIVQHIDQFV